MGYSPCDAGFGFFNFVFFIFVVVKDHTNPLAEAKSVIKIFDTVVVQFRSVAESVPQSSSRSIP